MKTLSILALTTSLSLAELELYPTLQFNGVIGDTSADSFGDVGGHGHDPNNEVAIQGIDVGLNLILDNWLTGFVNINAFTDAERELDSELEEAFLRFHNLPGGFEIRGGRFQNRIGVQNHLHLHSWDFANANLSTSQFLGEESLFTKGVELNWIREFGPAFVALTASFGETPDEEHGDEEEEEGGNSEEALFDGEVFTGRALFGYNQTDFHQHRLGFNGVFGENGYNRDTNLFSVDYTYTWRENGLEPGGRSFAIGAEYFYRDVEFASENNSANRGSTSQSSFMAFANYRFAEEWTASARYEHLQGRTGGGELINGDVDFAFVAAERDRVSLALTRDFQYQELDSLVRLQYSHDDLDGQKEDSVFLQIAFKFGKGEAR